jgi:hypothetical protein
MADTIYTTIKTGGETVSTIISVQTINTTTAISTFFSSTDLVVVGAGTLAISAGQMVDKISLIGGAQAFQIGTSLGGSEILARNMNGTVPFTAPLDYLFEAAGTLHLTGTFTAKIYLR